MDLKLDSSAIRPAAMRVRRQSHTHDMAFNIYQKPTLHLARYPAIYGYTVRWEDTGGFLRVSPLTHEDFFMITRSLMNPSLDTLPSKNQNDRPAD